MQSVDPYELLANGIVERAVEDYRNLWNWTKDDQAKRELIHFFYSQWFAILTKLDPTYLIEKLEEEADAKRKKIHR